MNIKLADAYVNQFITTQKGFSLHKGEVKEMDENDVELKSYVEQGMIVVSKEEPKRMIITDKIMTDTVKEVVSADNDVRKTLKEKPKSKKLKETPEDFIEE